MDLTILIIYTLALTVIFFYSLAQLHLFVNYIKSHRKKDSSPEFDFSKTDEIPFVTVQLPIYNEYYVVERLLNNIAKLDYPKNKLEIQVLDDSTDESAVSNKKQIENLQKTGLDIQHITRKDRVGYKAGALKDGLESAKGEFIAIFDSDFMPKPDWLKKTVPYFKDENIGVVQTRWGHLNRDYSLLTKIQAFALDFHFMVEQVGRNFGKHFINFNGTAGVWRKECILDAGNWNGDTLTEDLDLSYRAQLKNWKFKYLEDVETPAELPMVMSAARSQQFRWNKGAAENFQKIYPKLFMNKSISFKTKFHSFFHLLNSSMFLLIFLVAVLSVPVLYIKDSVPSFSLYFYFLAFFSFSTLVFFVCYWLPYSKIHGGGFKNFLKYIVMFIAFFCVAMGLSVYNSIAVIEGHLGKKSEFIRTPKFNVNTFSDSWKGNKYLKNNFSFSSVIEALLAVYFGFAIYSAFKLDDFGLVVFHLMLLFGFGFVAAKSWFQRV